MILQIMVYAMAMAAALSVVGLCLERLATLRGLPRRTAWIVALLLSVLLPPIMILRAEPLAEPPVPTLEPQLSAFEGVRTVPRAASLPTAMPVEAPPAPPPGRAWRLLRLSDGSLLAAWACASLLAALYLFAAHLRLRHRISGWQHTTLHEQPVFISETTGPALVGAFHPRLVIPRWLLDEPHATRSLILEHERQHIAAHDPLLIRAVAVLLAVLPWNLPLWWQWRRLRQAIELDCDSRVLRTGVAPQVYGEVLLAVVGRATRMSSAMVAMSEPVSALERRIQNLLPDPVRHVATQTMVAIELLVIGVVAAIAMDAPAIPQRALPQGMSGQAAASAVPTPSPPGDSDARLNLVMRAAVDKYPELIRSSGPVGTYHLQIVVRSNGTIYSSELNFLPEMRVRPATLTRKDNLLPRSRDGYTVIEKEQSIAGLGKASNEIKAIWRVLPADFDESRAAVRVNAAVQAKHSNLMLPTWDMPRDMWTPAKVFTNINRLTIFMTEDGQIAREAVELRPFKELQSMRPLPVDLVTVISNVSIPPGVPVEAFKMLGLDAEQVGQTGLVLVHPARPGFTWGAKPSAELQRDLREQTEWRTVIVRYAWPRRPGEPIGGNGRP
jgi:hypothetical protein